MVKQRSMKKLRSRSRSRKGGKSRARSMRRSRSMRGGNLTGDSSYSTLIASSSDNSNYLTSQSGDSQQNLDRNHSPLSGEGNNIDMTQFKGLIPPGAYYGGKRRRRSRMRGGMGSVSDDSEAMAADKSVIIDGSAPTQEGGRRRRRRMRGGEHMTTAMNPDTEPIPSGGMYDPPKGPGSTPTSGGTRQKRRGGGVIATAALPFGLFGLQKYFQGRKSETGTRTRRYRRRRS